MKNKFIRFLAIIAITANIYAEPVAKKNYYSPSEKFPPNPEGIKLIGHFVADRFSDGSIYLRADASSGEKDVNRRFETKNGNFIAGNTYTFTKSHPLIIMSGSFLGQYEVRVQTDQERGSGQDSEPDPHALNPFESHAGQ
jgi:hypothetical protein